MALPRLFRRWFIGELIGVGVVGVVQLETRRDTTLPAVPRLIGELISSPDHHLTTGAALC
jgi:hypothetical protein